MAKEDEITPLTVGLVRAKIDGSLRHPVNGKYIQNLLNSALRLMIEFRALRKLGDSYPSDPDNILRRSLVYDQRACEIYHGHVVLADTIWEDHADIRAREEIPSTAFRVSGEQFYINNLPPVPVIRCDANIPEEDLPELKKGYVLIDPYYKVL